MEKHKNTLLILLLVALVLSIVVFFQTQYSTMRAHLPQTGFHIPHNFPSPEPSNIAPWMTFDYINHVFGLPSTLLQDTLSIKNSHYPFLTLSSFAKQTGTTSERVLSQVQNAVINYKH